jgi:hypothetical protein
VSANIVWALRAAIAITALLVFRAHFGFEVAVLIGLARIIADQEPTHHSTTRPTPETPR